MSLPGFRTHARLATRSAALYFHMYELQMRENEIILVLYRNMGRRFKASITNTLRQLLRSQINQKEDRL